MHFFAHHKRDWVDSCPLEYRPLYYRRYVDDIFVLSKSSDHLKRFQSDLNSCHVKYHVIHYKQNKKISFLDVNFIREQGKIITSIYGKPTFSVVYTRFDSFLLDTYKIGMISVLVKRYFRICSRWSMSHQQLILLREIFQENAYRENVIVRCFKLFLNRIHIPKESVPTVQKKPLRLSFPFLGTISQQTRTKLQKSIKGVLTAVNYRLFLK